jgi:hypothetical protein
MKKPNNGGLFSAVLLAASLVITPFVASAQDSATPPAAGAEARQPRPYPFNGKINAVDKEKKTITLLGKEKNRTLHVDDKTRIVKNEKPASLADAAVGDEIAGQLRKMDDGREILVSLRIGPKPAREQPAPKE